MMLKSSLLLTSAVCLVALSGEAKSKKWKRLLRESAEPVQQEQRVVVPAQPAPMQVSSPAQTVGSVQAPMPGASATALVPPDLSKLDQQALAKLANPDDFGPQGFGHSRSPVSVSRLTTLLAATQYLTDAEDLAMAAERIEANLEVLSSEDNSAKSKALVQVVSRITDCDVLLAWMKETVSDLHRNCPLAVNDRIKALCQSAESVQAIPSLSGRLGAVSVMTSYEQKDILRQLADQEEDLTMAAFAALRLGGKRVAKVLGRLPAEPERAGFHGVSLGGDICRAVLVLKQKFPDTDIAYECLDGEVCVSFQHNTAGELRFRAPLATRRINWIELDGNMCCEQFAITGSDAGARAKDLFSKFGVDIDEEDDMPLKLKENGAEFASLRIFGATAKNGTVLRQILERPKIDEDKVEKIVGEPPDNLHRILPYEKEKAVRAMRRKLHSRLSHEIGKTCALILMGDELPPMKMKQ